MTRSALSIPCRCEQEWDLAPLPLTLLYAGVILLPAVTLFLGRVPACGRRIRPAVLSAFPFAKKTPDPGSTEGKALCPINPMGSVPSLSPSCPVPAALKPCSAHRASSRDSNQGDKARRKSLPKMQIFPQNFLQQSTTPQRGAVPEVWAAPQVSSPTGGSELHWQGQQ